MQYALLLNNAEPAEGEVPTETLLQMQRAMSDYTAALHAAGVFVGAEILESPARTVTVTRREGDLRVQDGPFADTREALAGVFILDVPDRDAAIAWAEKCPATQYAVLEVRKVTAACEAGVWNTAACTD
ncbi:YciI family protein [Tsukamurella sp. 8F]|uniref:YciI family protein n=1 Tax=unclassified Tsukamurella TaxID=2633480 RepID=UPI0023B8BB9F|nr:MULTISPECIES: YciI family protein [unclassified Tsukamurella]MDF0530114.1 YciI family protein [Tsukamurella sp. 8J]MDF0586432.1 YciI family protein [Tsukamurella sp. 8F]